MAGLNRRNIEIFRGFEPDAQRRHRVKHAIYGWALTRWLWWAVIPVILALFAGCATPRAVSPGGGTIAVWDLEDLTPSESSRPDLGELLAGKAVETIKENTAFTVVERQRLLLALEELNLGTTSLVNEDTRLAIGKMVGAKLMVFGGYQVVLDQMRLDLRLVEVETGKILKAAQQTTGAGIAAWLTAAQEATKALF